jgi:hypothetical protein
LTGHTRLFLVSLACLSNLLYPTHSKAWVLSRPLLSCPLRPPSSHPSLLGTPHQVAPVYAEPSVCRTFPFSVDLETPHTLCTQLAQLLLPLPRNPSSLLGSTEAFTSHPTLPPTISLFLLSIWHDKKNYLAHLFTDCLLCARMSAPQLLLTIP